jgi:chitinase
LIGRAQSQGAQVYVSIGGWSLSDNFPKVAANAVTRRNFAKNCVGLVREYGIDGIDVDWEFPGWVLLSSVGHIFA